ncbi:ROK family transcriptional regulator [Aquabacterium sp.]|uniref:ROK family transcriptional regulator n=1 Tax=Aquabacterium sp. TaxID=1872578 RepID=UPI002CCD344D|nr:ROK family transcriptional regulator [Aquabacterium sp.]HSW08473.1 ROK family transcriptional regulator [Aquabacterium sp.]
MPPDPHLRPRGSSQGGLRQFNERVVLQAIRLHGALPGAELARLTHLTAQTISLITKRLLHDGLLIKGEPQRGKVGQPSVPLALNPDGAYAIGIKIGRRSLDVLLVDFTGAVRERWSGDYAFPEPAQLLAEIGQRLKAVKRKLDPTARERMQGIGIAMPLSLGGWQTLLDMPPEVAARWPGIDLRAEVAKLSDWPVQVLKDTAAACVAELVAGRGRSTPSFLYIFVDTFIGGGLVLDSHLRAGVHGNAGAIGSLPMGRATRVGGKQAAPAQLLSVASLNNLERLYQAEGLDIAAVADERALQKPWLKLTERWLADAASAIAFAVNGTTCLLDLDCVILDGSFSRKLQEALLAAVERALADYSWEGINPPRLMPGTIGSDARAIGGALLPLYANFAPDRDLFLKIAVE